MITLGQLLQSLDPSQSRSFEIVGDPDTSISGIAYDSRAVTDASLFVALTGMNANGHDYVAGAMAAGARAIMVNRLWFDSRVAKPTVPLIVVDNTRKSLPYIASAFYGNPSQNFDLIGVTGTNGKTSVTYMVDSIMRSAGFSSAVLGTVGVQMNGEAVDAHWSVSTTPESCDLQALFASLRDREVQKVSMEVTSIAIDQERTACSAFDTAVFTNLTLDHLDYHGSFENYIQAKERLFSGYLTEYAKPGANAAINIDDPVGVRYASCASSVGARVMTYGIDSVGADLTASVLDIRPTSTRFTVRSNRAPSNEFGVDLAIGGLFNVSNALAAIAVAKLRGIENDAIVDGLTKMRPVPGRFEPVPNFGRGFDVIVDYAHTSDGLENVLRSARRLNPKRLIVVFGCGGNRDTKKRPLMGKLAVDLADKVIITSDNPRREDPDIIIDDILAGIEHARGNPKVTVLRDRRAAIEAAIDDEATEGDLVVIAGKGHETYQLVGDRVLEFDDRKVAAEVLSR